MNELQLTVADSDISNDTSTVETIHISEADLNFDLLNQFELDTGEPPFQMVEEGCAECFGLCNLKILSENLFKAVLQLERDFNNFHGDTLSKKPQVFKNVYKIVAPKIQNLNIPDEVILCLIRTRTYIRLNNLNNEQSSTHHSKKEEKIKKRKFTN
ncbi:unnamed protein product [Macrosiphum euphorbiae]|uniref:Uncharacterized protein n=1 Tax=Macrosiphum euphorbiae TaxID=13131 RepID=A0AAV0WJ87_9HEMI|nr:unnamed protein product [Macrosiphum euphorbiae]